mmetsp:Transcript_39604/g.86291  ORF Transcript_39604/g.86291 Transcript_39604/m.86291 type:complete len:565 (-) Transcript_39604:402-2096(-)|eukprot:CAMPEP_0118924500 /NCGR_PEP_ID=MMETSP1169-20130426/2607_1 /TAXON_ID=36882 /ORGANISM="Pyramimonas obovata, Strain CCMP722" /LENGTH=564 /DNA_ID=CAMNT_0006865621 /DNA_START=363 /DNA_END=2057 /DNA_ORIENTATION=+
MDGPSEASGALLPPASQTVDEPPKTVKTTEQLWADYGSVPEPTKPEYVCRSCVEMDGEEASHLTASPASDDSSLEDEGPYEPGRDELCPAPVELSSHYWDNVTTTYMQIWPLLVGNLLEWYEFGVFAYVEPQITENFFPSEAITWLVFSLSLIMRPLGGIIAGKLSDHLGRKTILVLAMWGMTISTIGQGLLPSDKTGGIWGLSVGMPLMIVLRIIQGLSAGAGIGGISTFLSEHSKRQNLGITVSWIHVSSNFANALAGGQVMLLTLWLSDDAMALYGWRIPFVIAAIPAAWLLGNIDRLHEEDEHKHLIDANEEGQKEEETINKEDSSFGSAWENTKKDFMKAKDVFMTMDPDGPWNVVKRNKTKITMLILALAPKVSIRYMAPIYGPTYVDDEGGSGEVGLGASVLSQFIVFLLALGVGWLTDLYGVGRVLIWNNILVLALGFPLFYLLGVHAENSLWVIMLLGVAFGILQSLVSTSYLYVAEMFITSTRGATTGFAYNTASAIWGGLAPFYATMLKGQIQYFPAWYAGFCGLIGTVVIFWNRNEHFAGRIRQVHIRRDPY